MPKRRLGVALLVPPPLDGEIDGLRRAVGDGALGRIPAHLTLVPPVNVREDRLDDAVAVLRRAAAETRPFSVELGPPATFHPVNPVLYLGVEGTGRDDVVRLRDAVFEDPLERKLTWPFVPHVTLADEADPARIEAAVESLRDYRVTMDVDRVHLLEEGPGRVWKPIADVPFERPAVVGRGGGMELEITRSQRLDPVTQAWVDDQWHGYSTDTYGSAETDQPFALVARRDGRVLGAAIGEVGPDTYLANLIVDDAERGTGVGSRLLAAVESLAAEQGCRRLTLRTQADGPARAFYEARGWTAFVTLPRWRRGRDFVQMERLLS